MTNDVTQNMEAIGSRILLFSVASPLVFGGGTLDAQPFPVNYV